MKLKVDSGGGDFLVQPAGMVQAVCCDVVDEGLKETPWGAKQKVSLRFQSAKVITAEDFAQQGKEPREEAIGEPFLYTAWFTASLNEKATLAKTLVSWGIKVPGAGEEFDLDSVIGRNALLNVEMQEREGKDPFAKVVTINPIMDTMTPIVVSPNYTRVQDREQQAQPPSGGTGVPAGAVDSDVPF